MNEYRHINLIPLVECSDTYDIKDNPYESLVIDITMRCNMDCQFCYNPARKVPDMTLEKFEEICASLPNVTQLKLLGGEPTLHKQLADFIRIGHKYGHHVYFNTNGTLFHRKEVLNPLLKLMEEGVPFKLGVSLDGGTSNPEAYRKLNGGDYLQKKLDGLKILLDNNFKRIMLSASIARGVNENAIQELIELAQEYPKNIRYIHFRNMGMVGKYEEIEEYTQDELKAMVAEHFTEEQFAPKCIAEVHCPVGSKNTCCHRFRPSGRLQISVLEMGTKQSESCHRRGKVVPDQMVVQSFYENMRGHSNYLQTVKREK